MIFMIFIASFFMFMNSNHPIVLGVLIICQSVMMAILIVMNFNFAWFSYILFMIYLGGILMIFSYIISISYSKEPLFKKKKWMISTILFVYALSQKETFLEVKKMELKNVIMPIYGETNPLSMFFMTLLFFIMMSVIFITEDEKISTKKN